jgi:leader peptidase (prepilin peptidase) / N-methyltransferase
LFLADFTPDFRAIILLLTFVVGCMVGSFLNVVGLRLLWEESFVFPASKCPQCKTPLKPWDNIPILSYLMLKGHCRTCKTGISVQYPLIELLTGLLFVAIIWCFGITWQSAFLLFFASNLVVILITDWRESLIFQINSLPLIPVGLVYNLLNLGQWPAASAKVLPLGASGGEVVLSGGFLSAMLGVLAIFIFFEGMILLSELIFKTEGFGHGDTHLMMGVAAFLGWEYALTALILGFIIQAVAAIPMMVLQWVQRKDYASIGLGSSAFISAAMPLFIVNLGLAAQTNMLLSMGFILLTLIFMVFFLKRVRDRQEFTYMPLGPALVLGTFIMVFAGPMVFSLLAVKH